MIVPAFQNKTNTTQHTNYKIITKATKRTIAKLKVMTYGIKLDNKTRCGH